MINEYISVRNLKFLLYEVFDLNKIFEIERFQDFSEKETIELLLSTAKDLGDKHLYPLFKPVDKAKAYYDEKEKQIKVHPDTYKILQMIGEGGWIGSYADYDSWGQQMPHVVYNAGKLIMHAANSNLVSYALLTDGAANLIRSFGTQEQKETYIPNMSTNKWQGTMALTEPQAGSSLADIVTKAIPQDDGTYRIQGQKIYISGGDYQDVENVIHLTLARIEGAPAGTKGISLFIVPKHRKENGALVPNDAVAAGLYGKMGQRGTVAAHMVFGENNDCHGYLVGQQNFGLKYMFQMMNEARIGTGAMAAGMCSGAYYASLKYANERPQGRHPSNKDLSTPQVNIIEHADVRRLLLMQKAITEGAIALVELCAYLSDLAEHGDESIKQDMHVLLELLTPIVKSYPAEHGILSTSASIQVLGGAGYIDEFLPEQYFRDIRISAIYEGTTAIHGMDILGRKVMMQNGRAFKLLMGEIMKTVELASKEEALQSYATKLTKTLQDLSATTQHLGRLAMKERPEVFLADATIYLDYLSLLVVGWLWLKQGVPAQKALADAAGDEKNFYAGKIAAMKYFFEYELPKTEIHNKRLMSNERVTLDVKSEYIN